MILDASLVFDPTGSAITVTRVSVNDLDLAVGRDLGVGNPPGRVLVLVTTAFASATATATLDVQFQGAPDNNGVAGAWTTYASSGATALGQLATGMKVVQFDIPRMVEYPTVPVATTGTYSSASTAVTVASATGILNGAFVTGTGIVPGTTVASGAGTTSLVLSQNTSAAGTAAALTFTPVTPLPRFYRLNYVASATMTAGAVYSFIALDTDASFAYRPGVTVPV